MFTEEQILELDGLNHIDEKIIEEAAEPVRTGKNRHKKLNRG